MDLRILSIDNSSSGETKESALTSEISEVSSKSSAAIASSIHILLSSLSSIVRGSLEAGTTSLPEHVLSIENYLSKIGITISCGREQGRTTQPTVKMLRMREGGNKVVANREKAVCWFEAVSRPLASLSNGRGGECSQFGSLSLPL